MAKGVKEDTEGIFPYRLADGSTKYQVRIRINGTRVPGGVHDDLGEARAARNRLREIRDAGGEAPVQPRKRGGRPPQRTVVSFIREEWFPTVRPEDEDYSGPTRGRARGKQGAKQLPLAKKTRTDFKNVMRKWIHKTELGGLDPTTVDAEHITTWIADCRKRGATDNTIRTGLKLLSNAFGWAATMPRSTGIAGNPVTSAAWPAEVRKRDIDYFEFEVTEWIRQYILNFAPAESEKSRRRKALLFSLMQGSAMRPEEARRVEAGHFEDGYIALPARISKTGRERYIPLWAPTEEEVRAFTSDYGLRPADPIIARAGGGAMTFTGWEKWVREIYNPARKWVAERLGDTRLYDPKTGSGARAYDVCRHRWARAQLAALIPPQEVADYMGHDLATLSRVYAGPIRDANKRRREDKKPYDPEAELAAAREKVETEMAAVIEEKRRGDKAAAA